MSYLYAGMGIAMMSGIFAMLQIANNLSNLSTINYQTESSYYTNDSVRLFDQLALKEIEIHQNSLNKPTNVCEEILSDIDISGYNLGFLDQSSGRYIESNHERFEGECLIENKNEKHRVIITNIKDVYKYYSCIYDSSYSKCDFE